MATVVVLAVVFGAPHEGRSPIFERVQDTVVEKMKPPAPVGDTIELKVLTYNVFVRPEPLAWSDEAKCRSRRIAERLVSDDEAPDIAVLTETFNEPDVEVLADTVRTRYPYQRLSLPRADGLLGISGGLSVVSRYPIESVRTEKFDTCSGELSDCLATKGILHAVVRIDDDMKVNVVATHMDAGEDESDRAARRRQLEQLRDFVDAHVDQSHWPTVMLGDFNVDGIRPDSFWKRGKNRLASEYHEMLTMLGHPRDVVREIRGKWRFDAIGTRALNTMNCRGANLWFCDDSPNLAQWWKRRKRLDYIFLVEATNALGAVATRIVDALHLPFRDDACGTKFLSDHHAVLATLELTRGSLAKWK